MNLRHDLRHDAPAARLSKDGSVPEGHSRLIEFNGVFLGAAVEHELGVRFVAADVRLSEMDRSIWPTSDFAYRSTRQLFKFGQAASLF